MEKKKSEGVGSEETMRLQKENAQLRRELAIETRVTKRWQALAGIFHDALINALRRYDPSYFEKLQKDAQNGASGEEAAGKLQEEARIVEAAKTRKTPALPPQLKNMTLPPQLKNMTLREENASLSEALTEQTRSHKRWEETAVRFHDTLWQVLLKYEPDTYGAICPTQAKEAASDFAELPGFEVQK